MRKEFIDIHHALHSDVSVVHVNDVDYPILKASNDCRYVWFEGVQIMQQNPHKMSSFAQRARNGEKISWAMTNPSWTIIDDAAIQLLSPKQETQPKTTEGESTTTKQPGSGIPASDALHRVMGAGDYRVTRNFWRQKS